MAPAEQIEHNIQEHNFILIQEDSDHTQVAYLICLFQKLVICTSKISIHILEWLNIDFKNRNCLH